MGNPKRGGKQSSNSGTSRSQAPDGLVIKKMVPDDTEEFTILTNDVNRDTSDSDISSNVHRTRGDNSKPIGSYKNGEVLLPGLLYIPELEGLNPTSLEQRLQNSVNGS